MTALCLNVARIPVLKSQGADGLLCHRKTQSSCIQPSLNAHWPKQYLACENKKTPEEKKKRRSNASSEKHRVALQTFRLKKDMYLTKKGTKKTPVLRSEIWERLWGEPRNPAFLKNWSEILRWDILQLRAPERRSWQPSAPFSPLACTVWGVPHQPARSEKPN